MSQTRRVCVDDVLACLLFVVPARPPPIGLSHAPRASAPGVPRPPPPPPPPARWCRTTVLAKHDARAGEQRGGDQDHAGAAVHAGAGHGPKNVPDQLRAGLPRQTHGARKRRVNFGFVRSSASLSFFFVVVVPVSIVVLLGFFFLHFGSRFDRGGGLGRKKRERTDGMELVGVSARQLCIFPYISNSRKSADQLNSTLNTRRRRKKSTTLMEDGTKDTSGSVSWLVGLGRWVWFDSIILQFRR